MIKETTGIFKGNRGFRSHGLNVWYENGATCCRKDEAYN